ncbi:MAG: hypothetical protein HY826_11585 [Actinobacteria bacterium]|nr:hypothetical protein [Actinomycetota bacterium]
MIKSELNSYSGSDPIWGFVALVGAEAYTGEAAVGLDPRVRLFAVDGRIYFAEREGDPAVGARLVNCGAISAAQLSRGAVNVANQESLARLFQRDATIDRDEVELTIATATESLLASIAHQPVGMPEVFPLRHHPSGIHHWLRGASGSDTAASVPVAETPAPVPSEPVEFEPVAVIPAHAGPDDINSFRDDINAVPPVMPAAPAPPPPLEPMPIALKLPRLVAAEPVVMPEPATAHEPVLATDEPPPSPTPTPMPIAPAPAVLAQLPTLAAGPVSMKDLKAVAAEAVMDSAGPTGAHIADNMAAVRIWEMVDDIENDRKPQGQLVTTGAPPPRKRGLLRKNS